MSKIIVGDERQQATKWQRPEFTSKKDSKLAILLESNNKANLVVSEEELNRIYEEARKEGHAKGVSEGMEQGRKLAMQEKKLLVGVIEHFMDPLKILDEKLEEEITSLAICVARQIVRREIKVDQKQIIGVVREAVSGLPSMYGKVAIYLNPADADIIREVYVLDKQVANVEIRDDISITRGGCRIETEESHIDATLENRIASVAAEIFGGERDYDQRDS